MLINAERDEGRVHTSSQKHASKRRVNEKGEIEMSIEKT